MAFLQQLFAAHPADAEVIVACQGGDPTLMGLEFFARSVELAARYGGPHQIRMTPEMLPMANSGWGMRAKDRPEPGLHYLCAGYKAFLSHVDAPMRFMADRLRAGQDATALSDWYAAADPQRGRNDPCTCGSGRRFTTCHGAPIGAAGP